MSKIQSLFNKRTIRAGLLAGTAALAATSYAMPGVPGDCQAQEAQNQAHRQDYRQALRSGLAKMSTPQRMDLMLVRSGPSSARPSRCSASRR